jgi:flavorubredoxin
MARKITETIYWIGVDAPDSRSFHGIESPSGGSYNSYLILDEHPTLIDTTNTPFFEDYIVSLRSVIDPKKIEYIIINHLEPDHAGALADVLAECTNATLVCTQKSKEFLEVLLDTLPPLKTIATEETISLGKHSLSFFPDPMVHWPETMVTKLNEYNAFFTSDLFGTEISHGGKSYRELIHAGITPSAFQDMTQDYYALIMRPFSRSVEKVLSFIEKQNPSSLFPSHGPYYAAKESIDNIMSVYSELTRTPEKNQVCIFYATIWNTTEQMATVLADEFKKQGKKVICHDIQQSNVVRMMRDALRSDLLCCGSLTMFTSYHPLYDTVFRFLSLNNQKNKRVLVFGTHGWAPGSVPQLKQKMQELSYEVVDESDVRFRLTDTKKKKLREIVMHCVEKSPL